MLDAAKTSSNADPICVDLDGTLIRSDMLIESALALIRLNPLYAFTMLGWLLRGKAYLKDQIAQRLEIDPALLPYNVALVSYLRAEKAKGRRIVLATASNARLAGAIADHLGLFDEVIASDADNNLAGERKLERLIAAFGRFGFAYAGNAGPDLAIWQHASGAIVVNPDAPVRAALASMTNVAQRIDVSRRSVRPYIKAMRPHQWLKNVLVFVPLLLAHRFSEPTLLVQALIAFLSFGLCASSVYILNDLIDLPVDRRHPVKRKRPFAAGDADLRAGIVLIPVLLGAAFGLALLLPPAFGIVLAAYYVCTLAYSLYVKRTMLFDVIMLAGLFTARIIAGGAAVSVPISFWLLAFSLFLFLSLALVKRYVELNDATGEDGSRAFGRGYVAADLESLSQFGIASGFMAVLVLALYIDSDSVAQLYSRPEMIWFLCPLALYLVGRIWLLARRGEMHDDPVVFAITDRRSQAVVGIGAGLLAAAAVL